MTVEAQLADGRTLQFPDGTAPEVVQATVKRMLAPQEKPSVPVSSPVSGLAGLTETAAALGTGAIATPVAGLAGLGQALANKAGLGSTDASDRVKSVQEALTYQPQTKVGQALTNAVAYPFEKLAEGADAVGGKVAEVTGSPALGAAVNAGIQTAVPYGLGKAAKAAKGLVKPVPEMTTAARDAGIAVTPSEAGAGAIAKTAESISGEPRLAKKLSVQNQPKVRELIAEDLGLKGEDLSVDNVFKNIANEGKAYAVVRKAGRIEADSTYKSALDEIGKEYKIAAEDFPGDKNPIIKLVENADVPSFDSNSAISKIITLRKDAKKAFRTGDAELGKANIEIANALEDQVGRHLEHMAAENPNYIGDFESFQKARTNIAKNYDALKAMNDATGDINPQAYAKMLKKGVPLTGNAKTVAELAQAFPRSLQKIDRIKSTGATFFDAFAAAAEKNWKLLFARPALRSTIASTPAQALMARPSMLPGIADLQATPAVVGGEIAAGQRGSLEDYNSVLRKK